MELAAVSHTAYSKKDIAAAIVCVVALAVLGFVIAKHTVLAEMSPAEASRRRIVIDSETGEVIADFRIKEGLTIPYKSPSSGKNTLYPAEACYWTKDGKAKIEPTYVLLNSYLGKAGDTLCPDCGRKVVSHNPSPPNELMIKAYENAQKSGKYRKYHEHRLPNAQITTKVT